MTVSKSRPNAFKQPVLQTCTVLNGGLLKKQEVLSTAGPDSKYVKLCKLSPWLCLAVTGKTYGTSPLHRTTLIAILLKSIQEQVLACGSAGSASAPAAVPGDKMSLLAVPKPTNHYVSRVVKQPRSLRKKTESCCTVDLHGASVRTWQKQTCGAVWVHVDDLPVVLERLHLEYKLKGVAEVEENERVAADDGLDDDVAGKGHLSGTFAIVHGKGASQV